MKKGLILFLLMGLLFTMAGCRKKHKEEDTNLQVENIEEGEDIEVDEVEPEGIASPLSGLYAEEEKVNRRPYAVVFDNQIGARPQAGLIDAEIAYEFLAEGDITRYLGIFLIKEPDHIGPIRSARPYLVEKALEFDSYFVHVGGSPQAMADIKSKKVADIDSLSRGKEVFWRKSHKKMPHNLYSSHDAIKKAAGQSKYREEAQFEAFKFNPSFQTIEGGQGAEEVRVRYFNNKEAAYIYDGEAKEYKRHYNGQEHKDEISGQTLTATNIIIQEVGSRVIDDQLRLQMDTVGEGRAKYISGGSLIDIVWKKPSYEGITKYYYENGQELSLNPGKTWIQVVRNFDKLTIE